MKKIAKVKTAATGKLNGLLEVDITDAVTEDWDFRCIEGAKSLFASVTAVAAATYMMA